MFNPIRHLSRPVGRGIAVAALLTAATMPLAPGVFAEAEVSGTASPNPVYPGGTVTFTVTIANPQICIHVFRTVSCTGRLIANVSSILSGQSAVSSVSADSGFSCGVQYGKVNCSNGIIAANGSGHITITAIVPQPAYCAPSDLVYVNNVAQAFLVANVPGLSYCSPVN